MNDGARFWIFLAVVAGIGGFGFREEIAVGVSAVLNGPRAVRNNNPLNIERGQSWRGLMPLDRMNAAQRGETRFAVFEEPKWGFRAGAVILRNYQRLHGIRTIRKAINRWAPPSENHTETYVRSVAQAVGIHPDQTVDLASQSVLLPMMREMARVEAGGNYFTDADIIAGIQLERS